MVTDKGIYKEDISRSLLDYDIHMRWTVFVTKIDEVRGGLIISTAPNSYKLEWFYPKCVCDCNEDKTKINIVDENGITHIMNKSPLLLDSLRKGIRYVEIPKRCYVPVMDVRCWYMMF
jgi:hypothetical protein